jgi:sugar phosphate isomerase/epimerase
LGGSLAWVAALAVGRHAAAAPVTEPKRNSIAAFIKFMQSMSYEELADAVAGAGFDGIEATVRGNGYIKPERAPDELPKLAEVLATRNLKIMIVATDVVSADDPHTRPLLTTAKQLGIPMYRLGFYNYDLAQPVLPQLAEIKPKLAKLAALNGEIGIQGVYQNHSGADIVGATVWDFYGLMEPLPASQIDFAFDIRHATIEAGLAWPAVYNAVKSRVAAIYVKDFDWRGRQAQHVPLGEGRVDRNFFKTLGRDDFRGPISLHVEYLGGSGAKENLAALTRDLATLRGWLAG